LEGKLHQSSVKYRLRIKNRKYKEIGKILLLLTDLISFWSFEFGTQFTLKQEGSYIVLLVWNYSTPAYFSW
jgi:hypothetical protein